MKKVYLILTFLALAICWIMIFASIASAYDVYDIIKYLDKRVNVSYQIKEQIYNLEDIEVSGITATTNEDGIRTAWMVFDRYVGNGYAYGIPIEYIVNIEVIK